MHGHSFFIYYLEYIQFTSRKVLIYLIEEIK